MAVSTGKKLGLLPQSEDDQLGKLETKAFCFQERGSEVGREDEQWTLGRQLGDEAYVLENGRRLAQERTVIFLPFRREQKKASILMGLQTKRSAPWKKNTQAKLAADYAGMYDVIYRAIVYFY